MRHNGYSQTREPNIGDMSSLQTHQGISSTHSLMNQGQTVLVGLKYSKAQQPLTD